MRPERFLATCIAFAVVRPAAPAQTEYLIDFGDHLLQTGAQAQVWNDFHDKNWTQPLALVDSAGNPSALTLTYTLPTGRAVTNGVQTAAPGSELEQLGWPFEAISDAIGNDSLTLVPTLDFLLSGLDPLATYDVTILGSVLESGVSLASEYTAQGIDDVATIGEVAQNVASVQHLRGIRPRADATLELQVRSATTNTSYDRRYYINAVSIVEHPAGTQPAVLGFLTDRLDVGRVVGKGSVVATLGLYTSDGSLPSVDLLAVDPATGLEPTWLGVPPTAEPGTPFDVVVYPSQLAPGTYVAHLFPGTESYVRYGMSVVLVVRDPGRLNLLYFGNSYTNANGTVYVFVEQLAAAAGLEVPASVPRLGSGTQLGYHLNPSVALAIARSLPLGEEWDFAVLQGGTTEAAATVGNPAGYVADGLELLGNVRAHSPEARAVVFQTWARGLGHSLYQGNPATYPTPLAMHLDLEAGNQQLVDAIEATYGAGAAVLGAAGETAALRGFDPAIYKPDLSHPERELTAQASATLFSAIYGLPVCGQEPDFETPGPLASHLLSIGLDQEAWERAAGIGDRAGLPGLRPYPGSGEDFLLSSGSPGHLTACSQKVCPAGASLRFELTSPGGSLLGRPALMYLDQPGHHGGTTTVPPWSEVHYTSSAWAVAATTQLGPGGLGAEMVLPLELVGHTLLVQGLSEGPSASTGHAFTFSDAHAVQVLTPGQLVPTGATENP